MMFFSPLSPLQVHLLQGKSLLGQLMNSTCRLRAGGKACNTRHWKFILVLDYTQGRLFAGETIP